MSSDHGSSARLSRLTRLNLSGAQNRIIAECVDILDDLELAELLIVGHAAVIVGRADVLAAACTQLRAQLGDNVEVMRLRMQLGNLTGNRTTLIAVVDSSTEGNLPEQGRVLDAFVANLIRAHAYPSLARLIGLYETVGELGTSLMAGRAIVNLRRRSYQSAFLDAETAYDMAPGNARARLGLLLARCAQYDGDYAAGGTVIAQTLGGPDQGWASRTMLYKAAWAAFRARRSPIARVLLERAENRGAAGAGVLRLKARLHAFAKEYDAARGMYQKLLDRDSDDLDATVGLCDALAKTRPPEEVLEYLDKVLQRQDIPELLARRIALLRQVGKDDQADHEDAELKRRFPETDAVVKLDGYGTSYTVAEEQAPDTGNLAQGEPPSKLPPAFQPQWTRDDLRVQAGMAKAARIHGRVIGALLLREIRTRFGRLKLGYLWALLEPLLHASVLYVIWSVRPSGQFDGLPLEMFLILGLVPFFLFAETYTRLSRAVQSNQGLLSHRQVTPYDVMMARAVLEFLTRIVVLTIFLCAIALAGIDMALLKPLQLLSALIVLWVIGAGLGMLVQAYSSVLVSLPNIVGAVVRFLYLTSGVLFPLSILPYGVQQAALLNPMAHLIQLTRNAFVPLDPIQGVTMTYPLYFGVGGLVLGLMSLKVMQRKVLSS